MHMLLKNMFLEPMFSVTRYIYCYIWCPPKWKFLFHFPTSKW
jgi:hypothetical protein